MIDFPSANGADGDRDARGRFVKGWRGGPGNPHAKRVARLRSAMIRAATDDDIREIMARLVELAKAGDIAAAREVLDRVIGKAAQMDVLQRIEAIERQLAERFEGSE